MVTRRKGGIKIWFPWSQQLECAYSHLVHLSISFYSYHKLLHISWDCSLEYFEDCGNRIDFVNFNTARYFQSRDIECDPPRRIPGAHVVLQSNFVPQANFIIPKRLSIPNENQFSDLNINM